MLALEAHGIPVGQQFAPRQTKAGTLDLTASTLFVGAFEKHAQIVNYARTLNKLVSYRHAQVNFVNGSRNVFPHFARFAFVLAAKNPANHR